MTAMLTPPDDYVPSSYEDVAREYYDYIRACLLKLGVNRENADDATQEILMKFTEKDFLGKFDPEVTVVGKTGKVRRTSFRRWITVFTMTYGLQPRERQRVQAERVPYRLEAPMGAGGTWADVDYATDDEPPLFDAVARQALAALAGDVQGVMLTGMFRAIAGQVLADGKVNRRELGETFGMSPGQVAAALRRMQSVLTEVGLTPTSVAA